MAYSHHDLIFLEKDKVVAFSSIAECIKKVLATKIRYNIFYYFLSWLLLWKRAAMESDQIFYNNDWCLDMILSGFSNQNSATIPSLIDAYSIWASLKLVLVDKGLTG